MTFHKFTQCAPIGTTTSGITREFPRDPEIPLLGLYSLESKTGVQTETCTRMSQLPKGRNHSNFHQLMNGWKSCVFTSWNAIQPWRGLADMCSDVGELEKHSWEKSQTQKITARFCLHDTGRRAPSTHRKWTHGSRAGGGQVGSDRWVGWDFPFQWWKSSETSYTTLGRY